jgi:DNA-binding Xre family transcriptional regulator
MPTGCNKLIEHTINLGMKKGDLCVKTSISKSGLAKMDNGARINTGILERSAPLLFAVMVI